MMDSVSHGDSLSARRSISHPTLRLRDVAEKLTNCAGTAWLSECSHMPKKLQPGLGRARYVGILPAPRPTECRRLVELFGFISIIAVFAASLFSACSAAWFYIPPPVYDYKWSAD